MPCKKALSAVEPVEQEFFLRVSCVKRGFPIPKKDTPFRKCQLESTEGWCFWIRRGFNDCTKFSLNSRTWSNLTHFFQMVWNMLKPHSYRKKQQLPSPLEPTPRCFPADHDHHGNGEQRGAWHLAFMADALYKCQFFLLLHLKMLKMLVTSVSRTCTLYICIYTL